MLHEGFSFRSKSMTTKLSTITKEELEEIVLNCSTYADVLRKLDFINPAGSSYRCLKDKIKQFNISTSHMTHYSNGGFKIYSNEEMFIKGSKVAQSALRTRVKRNNLIPYKCAICGNTGEWNNKPLTLTLDHINGNRTDNRLENLRYLCPNCDRQQDTFGAKNKTRYYNFSTKSINKKVYRCDKCGKFISKGNRLCMDCYQKLKAKNIPPKEVIIEELKNFTTFVALGKKYNVSDNTVRKWCKKYNLPSKTSEVQEWLQNCNT